jgi:TRAP-type C4-dicarboxylate transport system substrate-binding protein
MISTHRSGRSPDARVVCHKPKPNVSAGAHGSKFLPALARPAAIEDIEKNRTPKGAKAMSGAKGNVIWRATAAMFALALALLSVPVGPAAAAEKWDLYIYNPVSTVAAVKGLNTVIEQIEKETGGELSIRLHLGGSLPINTTTITQAVSDDVVQMGDDGYFLGNVPIGGVLRLPMLLRTLADYDKAATIMNPYLEKAFEKKGLLVLGQYLYPFQVAFSSKKLISLADIKGQKIRVTSPEQSEFIRRLGGIPVTIGAPQVPSALDRGVVDGVLTASTGGGNIWKDLLKYNYRLGINYFNSVLIVNSERFAKLSPDIQKKVRRIVSDNMPLITKAMADDEDDLTRKFADGGMTVTKEDPQDIEAGTKLIAPYWEEWARTQGPDAIAALKQVRTAIGR